ncbi:MAG: hypothetical protein ABI151_05705 [Chitinophagaceae bacterium]
MQFFKGILILGICWNVSSCKTFSKTQLGEAIGLKTGTFLGAVVGDAAGNESAGTVIGGSLGAATGEAMVKSSLDKLAEEITDSVNDATIRKTAETLIVEFKTSVLFRKNNSAIISEKAKANLDKLVTILIRYRKNKIAITVFNRNKRETAESLSEKRVAMLGDYLRVKGVASSRISFGRSDVISKSSLVSIILS